MTTVRNVLFGCVGLCMLAISPLAQAQNDSGSEGTAPKWHANQHIQEIFRQLNLTDDQKKQLESNKQDHRGKMEHAHQEMKTQRDELQQELMKPHLDMARINGIHNQIKSLQSQMEDEKLSSILTVRAILTPEQFQEFINLMPKRRTNPAHDD